MFELFSTKVLMLRIRFFLKKKSSIFHNFIRLFHENLSRKINKRSANLIDLMFTDKGLKFMAPIILFDG